MLASQPKLRRSSLRSENIVDSTFGVAVTALRILLSPDRIYELYLNKMQIVSWGSTGKVLEICGPYGASEQ
jgi:hypothetical protein